METLSDWSTLPAEIKARFDALEDFIGGLDEKALYDGDTIDASDAVKAINVLAADVANLCKANTLLLRSIFTQDAKIARLRADVEARNKALELNKEESNHWFAKASCIQEAKRRALAVADERSKENVALRSAFTALIEKLDYVHADKAYQSVWAVHQIHVGPYAGPTYEKELAAAREALK